MEAQIIGYLNNNPSSKNEIVAEFPDADKGEVGLAILNLLDEKMITADKKGKLQLTDKAKAQYRL